MQRKRWLGLWVLLGLLALGGAWTLGWSPVALPDGPLSDPEQPPFTDAFGGHAEPGATHSFGWTVLTNSGVQPAVLDSVTPKETTGLELIGAYTVPGSQTFHINRDYTFPPRGYENVGLIPAAGSARHRGGKDVSGRSASRSSWPPQPSVVSLLMDAH